MTPISWVTVSKIPLKSCLELLDRKVGQRIILYKQILVSIVLASNMIDPLKGGWGYLIVMCAILVAVINQGLQLSTSLMAAIADRSFHVKGPQFGVYSGGKTDFS